MPQILSPEEAIALFRPGHKVFLQGALGLPTALTDALAANPDASEGVHYALSLIHI